MPDYTLPDDSNDWPDDPFQLLGVALPLTEHDVKRAYTRLIRRFKPEHHPEQFRRIREAYENALQRLKWLSWYPAFDPPPPPVEAPKKTERTEIPELPPATPAPATELPESAPVESDRDTPSTVDEALAAPVVADFTRESREPPPVWREPEPPPVDDDAIVLDPSRPRVIDPVEEAWKLAVDGRRAEAYEQLATLAQSWPERPDLPLRLYWLLALEPELDAVRNRHDWLFAALKRSQLYGPAVELYARELEANAAAALNEPYARLLELEASGGSLLLLARQRLNAAGAKRAWESIDLDVRALSERISQVGESGWLSHLVAATAYACFDKPAPLYERCRSLLAGLKHLELREEWAFDQLEEKQQQAQVWNAARLAPGPLREVVRDSWTAPADVWKKSMHRAALWAAEDPVSALDQFDIAARTADCQPVVAAFQRLLDDCERPRTVEYPHGLIRGLVREFLTGNGRGNYHGIRPELLRFLVREAIDPEELVAACSVDAATPPRILAEHVQTDQLMRLVWRTAHAQP